MRPSPRSNLLFSVFLCDLFVIIFIFFTESLLTRLGLPYQPSLSLEHSGVREPYQDSFKLLV